MQSGEGADSGSFLMAADAPVRRIEISGNLPCPIHPLPESLVGRLVLLGRRLDGYHQAH